MVELKKITNQQIYDTLYAYIKAFDCYKTLNGGLMDEQGNRSFIGQLFSTDQIERMEALVIDEEKYWKVLRPVLEGWFEDPSYMWMVESLHNIIPDYMHHLVYDVSSPYYSSPLNGEVYGCEIALLSDLNLLSSNPSFGVQVRPV